MHIEQNSHYKHFILTTSSLSTGSLRLSRGQFAEDATSLTSLTMPELTEAAEAAGGGGPSLAAFRHLRSSEDIESFIANMAVPPPPSLAAKQVPSDQTNNKK